MTLENHRRVVLAVGAHPDDVEINCAGTLRLLKKNGYEIHVATMTLGDCGSRELPAAQICAQRRREAESACAMLGATYHYAGSHDFCIFNDDRHNRTVTALIRDVSPEIVLTHQPHDYIVDHEATSVLVRNACFYAPAPNYDTATISPASPIAAIPYLYYWDVMEGIDIFGKPVAPQFFVDIGSEIDFKAEMLACHASQREWLRAQHGIDEYINTMREWSAIRGGEAAKIAARDVTHAEAFRQHLGHAYPHTNILADILGQHLIANPSY